MSHENYTKTVDLVCPECKSHWGAHSINCSLMNVKQRADKMMEYYNAWLRDTTHYLDLIKKYREQQVLWQGKFCMVKHENNKLRKRNKHLEAESGEGKGNKV